jgi:hypothetical protein
MPARDSSGTAGGWLRAACLGLVGLCLAACLGSGLVVGAWVELPQVNGQAEYVYLCAGANLYGRFRVGYGYASNLAGMIPVTTALPQALCGYWPRPPFLFQGSFGLHIFQP